MASVDGWTAATTESLLDTRQNLLRGLVLVHNHMVAGTVHDIQPGRASSPADAGLVTWALLQGCEAELTRRNAL